MTALSLIAIALAGAPRQKAIDIIRDATSSNPVSLRTLQDRTGLSARAIKRVVEFARSEGAPICARRGAPCGYYWATSVSDLEASARTMTNQAVKMLRSARELVGVHRLRQMLGQEVIEELR
jgi:hypothetical protein